MSYWLVHTHVESLLHRARPFAAHGDHMDEAGTVRDRLAPCIGHRRRVLRCTRPAARHCPMSSDAGPLRAVRTAAMPSTAQFAFSGGPHGECGPKADDLILHRRCACRATGREPTVASHDVIGIWSGNGSRVLAAE
ncbi:MAG: hypothetical protein QOI01_7061 [Mycobacterium sp.]|jgi:hypothetical protein|nr:hypothetical protein [Mycobacterium sp.]